MDSTTVIELPRDETAARNRFENFKLGKGLPSTLASNNGGHRHGHARSHSRNRSISNSLSLSSSTNMNDIASFSFPMSNSTPAIPSTDTLPGPPRPLSQSAISPNPGPPSQRASHHRRRSSVSTRRESAELMGITLPDLPASASEANINLGEKDSIRRRALWALEGKPDVSFNKVEIPELTTPDAESFMFDIPTKQSFNTGSGCSFGPSGIGSKRDSFKLLGSSSCSKDQLHTLLEEEEEEDEQDGAAQDDSLTSMFEDTGVEPSIEENIPPAVAITKPTPSKPRPATLNLRPLALTPEALTTAVQGLPTPTATPSPRSGLRPLSLSSNASDSSETSKQERRSSLVISPSPGCCRPVLNVPTENLVSPPNKSEEDKKSGRRSSIGYKTSSYNGLINNLVGLPTPEMTPTFGRRYSYAEHSAVNATAQMTTSSISDDEFFPNPPTQSRPLSTSEQYFLFKSHHALVARIGELERVLSVLRRRESGGYANSNCGSSRPQSMFSDSSVLGGSDTSNEPVNDEMLQLISDLKAERDELMKDMDGWRQRVADLENQNGILAKRIYNERQEAWVARSRTGILEHEKDILSKKLISVEDLFESTNTETLQLRTENSALKADNEGMLARIAQLEAHIKGLNDDLAAERKAKEDALATPRVESHIGFGRHGLKHGMGLPSLDSESSATDVESSDEGHIFDFTLKSVQEEDEDHFSDQDGLAGYEDEDEDTNTSLQSSSSYDSEDDDGPFPPRIGASDSFSAAPRTFSKPTPELAMTWTFPKVQAPRTTAAQIPETEDRFFGCLDDDSETAGSVPNSPLQYSYEQSKGMFAQGFKYADDDDAPFFVPTGLGLPVHDDQDGSDDSLVVEEHSNDFESDTDVDEISMFGQMGGITITFTPAHDEPVVEEKAQLQVSPAKRTSPPPTLPALNFGSLEEDDDQTVSTPFSFGSMFKAKDQPMPELAENPLAPSPSRSTDIVTPPSSSSPSMLPRPSSPSVNRYVSPSISSTSTPESPSMSGNSLDNTSLFMESSPSYATPPVRRGIVSASFIPQPVSSPSPIRTFSTASKPRLSSMSPTFIRQPTRVPLLPSSVPKTPSQPASKMTNGSTMIPPASSFFTIANASINMPSLFRSPQSDTPSGNTTAPVVNTTAGFLDTKSGGLCQNPHSTSQIISPSTSQTPGPTTLTSVASSRMSFQALTSFISPWSSRSTPADVVGSQVAHTSVLKKDAFVPRQRQLHKLMSRLKHEGKITLADDIHLQCSDCYEKIVVI